MLTSVASHYLHPDYLQPLPSMLDAKKSPLALLAQTCSSIGSDLAPSTKSIIPPIEKESHTTTKDQQHSSTHSSSSRKTESPANSVKSDGRRSNPAFSEKKDVRSPGSATSGRTDSPRGGFQSPSGTKDIPPLVPISSPRRHSNEKSPPPRESSKCARSESCSSASGITHLHSSVNVSSSSSSSSSYSSPSGLSSSKPSITSANSFLDASRQQESISSGLSRPSPALAASHPSVPASMKLDSITSYSGLPHTYAGCQGLPMFGHALSMESNPLYPTPLSAAASGALGLSALQKAGAMSGLGNPAAISPYMSYARVKTASGATTLVPVCKDPYCTHCQLTMHSAQTASCPAGCAQCNHEKTLGGMHPGLPHAGLGGMLAASGCSTPGVSSLPLTSSLYPHSFGMLPGHSAGLPYVCNWMNGSDYCGKRFPTSEELLQHLRTHTSSAELPALSAASLHQYASLGLTNPAAMAYGGYPSPYPAASPGGALSPSSLRQAYPRTLSPSSLLAASRYHPYKSALSGLPSAAHTLLPGVPSALGAYYSPYSLYGHRLGSAAVP
ncbi:Zinc finger protein Noc [Lamellibrachia satsuma]|nr:Zinc finger protein Noc [Lamellibrachia satsuma]